MKPNSTSSFLMGASALMLLSAGAAAVEAEIGKATVSFNGLVDVWAGSSEAPGSSDSTAVLGANGMTTSFLAIGASVPLTDSLTGIAAAEMFFQPDTGDYGRYDDDELFARNAYVGLAGDFGTVTGGRNTSPYFLPTVFFNPFGGSFAFSPAILHTFQGGNYGPLTGDSGWSNSVSYTTPTFSGITANLTYGFGEQQGEAGENKIGGNVIYRNGNFGATLAAHRVDGGAYGEGEAGPLDDSHFSGFGTLGTVDSQTAALLGTSYDFGVVKLFGQYQVIDTELTLGDVDIDTYQLGVSVPAGNGKVLASYGYSDFSKDLDDERTTMTVGYDYVFNNFFDIYTVAMRDEIDSLDDGFTYGVGARFSF